MVCWSHPWRSSGRAAVAALTAVGVLLMACAPSAPGAPPAPTTGPAGQGGATAAPASKPAAPAQQTGPAPAASKAGGTLTIDTGATKIKALDPNYYDVMLEKNVTSLVAEPLIFRDETFKMVPALATSWKVADDGVTWTLELRQGVKFHDGTPFNAEAVKANFERWKDPAIRSSTLKNVVGPAIKSIEVVNEHGLRVVTDGPRPGFPDMLSGWAVQIVSPTALKQHGPDIAVKQSGTGPFKIQSFVPDESLTLVANGEYWGGAPKIERLVFRSIPEASARTAALLTGQADLSINLPPSQVPRLKGESNVRLQEQPPVLEQWIEMHEKHPPLDNPQVRRAIAQAINPEEIKNVVYEGFMRPFQGPVPPELFQADQSIKGIEYNQERARELLKQAGVSSARVRFVFEESPVLTRLGEVLQSQLKQVGIDVELVRMEQAAAEEAYIGGNYDLIINGFSNSSGDPWAMLRAQLQSSARNNSAGHSHPKYDQLIEQIGTTIDPAKRAELLNEFYRAYFEAVPYALTWNEVWIYASNNKLQGFAPYPNLDLNSLKTATLKE